MKKDPKLKKLELDIQGMHCASCEVLIERKLKKVEGVEHIRVNHATGKARLYCSEVPQLSELQNAVREDGYTLHTTENAPAAIARNTTDDYVEIGALFLLMVIVFFILKELDLVPSLGITDNMSYGVVFLIGLVAASSTCIAVTGGLLLAVAGKYNEQHPDLTGYQKFKPTLYFNLGRIIGYTILGGLVGALGSVITLSVQATGLLTIVVSLVMVLLGFQLLHLFPGLRRFQPKMPKFLAHKIHDASNSDHKGASLLLGALTFFLPCGFTQALQLYVLSTGNWMTGSLTMFFFALGTLPALLSLSAISSFAKGNFQKHFLKVAGVVVVLLGLFNIQSGLNLAGIDPLAMFNGSAIVQAGQDPNVQLVDGKQVVKMKVRGYDYIPSRFTVAQGIPVEWQIDGSEAAGCAQVITLPKMGITEYLPKGVKTIAFTPSQTGELEFKCTMGMTTRGAAFIVVPNTEGSTGASTPSTNPQPEVTGPVQKLSMSISRDKGFFPNTFTVKKDMPVELDIDTQTPMGGCMSTMVIPKYNIAHLLSLGKTTLRFTPTQIETIRATCPMGSPMIAFQVVE